MHSRRIFAALAFLLLFGTVAAVAQTLPNGVQKVTSVEGITEYSLPNGLHVLLFPDGSQPKITDRKSTRLNSSH